MRDRAENRIMIGAVMMTVDFTEGFWEGWVVWSLDGHGDLKEWDGGGVMIIRLP